MRRLPIAIACALALATAPAAWGQASTGPTATTGVPAPGATTPAPAAGTPAPTLTTDPDPSTAAPATTTQAAPGATATQPAATTQPGATTTTTDDSPNALLVGLAVLLALGAIAVAGWGIARLTAWEPAWLAPVRHSIGEAGYRTGATWAEFRDWLRPSR
jgi:hypothetical protein